MVVDDLAEKSEPVLSLSKKCFVEEGYIVFRGEGLPEYDIALSRCATHEALIAWVSHLCSKTWMTVPLLRCFVEVAAQHHGLKVHNIPA